MVSTTLRWVVRHEKRTLIVISLTFVTGLLLLLPAVEEYSTAKARIQTARQNLDEANQQLQNLPLLRRTFEERKRELEHLEKKALTPREVENLRGNLQQLIRENGCVMRTLDISDAFSRPWSSNDSPTRRVTVGPPGQETPYMLVSRTATLRMEGEMANVYQFLARASQLERFLHAKQIRLERSVRDENLIELEMHFELFDLTRKKSA